MKVTPKRIIKAVAPHGAVVVYRRARPYLDRKKLEREQRADAEFWKLRHKLFGLGFKKAEGDLKKLLYKTKNKNLKYQIALDLSVYYANQGTKPAAKTSLKYLSKTAKYAPDAEREKIANLQSECYLLLGRHAEAQRIIRKAIKTFGRTQDLLLGLANTQQDIDSKIKTINEALSLYGHMPIKLRKDRKYKCYFDGVEANENHEKAAGSQGCKVSIIMTVYNAEDTVSVALDSILNQTWQNFEIIVVDDCSKDRTRDIVKSYAKNNSQIRLIESSKNAGTYVARNKALKYATGEFVTGHDADDWSHPERIEIQVKHLLSNPQVMGNISQYSRVTNELQFSRNGYPGLYIRHNFSSLMFRRNIVLKRGGYWDSVRFGADGEYLYRIRKIFGDHSVEFLTSGILSFIRKTTSSLTGDSAFGISGYLTGARFEYEQAWRYFHENSKNLKIPASATKRKFSVPRPMLPEYNKAEALHSRRRADVVYVADFRKESMSKKLMEIVTKASLHEGQIHIVQMADYNFSHIAYPDLMHSMLNSGEVKIIVYGERVSCNDLVILDHQSLIEKQAYIPDVEYKNSRIIYPANIDKKIQKKCEKNFKEYFTAN